LNSIINQKKKTTMKKIMIAFSTALVLAACGNGNGSTATTDSTQATVDSSAVIATDSTTSEIAHPAEAPVGSTGAAEVQRLEEVK
jgi:hypothetical protein